MNKTHKLISNSQTAFTLGTHQQKAVLLSLLFIGGGKESEFPKLNGTAWPALLREIIRSVGPHCT